MRRRLTRSVIGACCRSACSMACQCVRLVALQAADPPLRMVPHRHRILPGQRHQRVAFAQKAAQAAVDEAGLRLGGRVPLGRFHRLVDQRERLVRRVPVAPGQRQHHAQQGICRGRWRPRRQLPAQVFGTRQRAPDLEHEGLHAWPQSRRDLVQRGRAGAAGPHRHDAGRRGLQLAPQGDGRARVGTGTACARYHGLDHRHRFVTGIAPP